MNPSCVPRGVRGGCWWGAITTDNERVVYTKSSKLNANDSRCYELMALLIIKLVMKNKARRCFWIGGGGGGGSGYISIAKD